MITTRMIMRRRIRLHRYAEKRYDNNNDYDEVKYVKNEIDNRDFIR